MQSRKMKVLLEPNGELRAINLELIGHWFIVDKVIYYIKL